MADGREPRDAAAAHALLRIAPGFFGFVDRAGRILDLDDKAAEIIGTTRAALLGQVFWECLWWAPIPESAAKIRAHIAQGFAGETSQVDLGYWAHPAGAAGHIRCVEICVQPVPGDDGRIERVAVTGVDVTQRKDIEKRLAVEHAKLAAIFRESPAAMAVWRGADLVFELVNPAYEAIFPGRRLHGKPLLEAIPELADQVFPGLITRVLETGEPVAGKEALVKLAKSDDGPLEDHYYDFTYARIEDGEGGVYGVYVHAVDVTERVVARRDLEEHRNRLADAVQAFEVERDLRERMVAALTHDLRTPLSNARLAADLILSRVAPGSNEHRYATRIVNNVGRADYMIRDLLDASRIEAGESLPLTITDGDAVEVVRTTLEEMAGASGDRFVLRAPAALRGRWDRGALQRIVENLVGNALKYGEPRAPITVDIEGQGDTLRMRVHNQGRPIPAAEQGTLFDLFKRGALTGTREVQGWGVGLSLVRGLAVAHGGDVAVYSVAGDGTTFTVSMPIIARGERTA